MQEYSCEGSGTGAGLPSYLPELTVLPAACEPAGRGDKRVFHAAALDPARCQAMRKV
jgi:hypothetical protein